jgi:WW domain
MAEHETDVPPTSASGTAHSPAESSERRERITSAEDKAGDGRSDHEGDEQEGESMREGGEEVDGEEEDEAPPLPDEEVPPLPDEVPPGQAVEGGGSDDGWEPVWDANAQAYYFYNRITGLSQWENPRVPAEPTETTEPAAGVAPGEEPQPPQHTATAGGYNPAIHGDYDPTAPYAQQHEPEAQIQTQAANADYSATGTFNRFTGRWQDASLAPENFNDENKSRRQMHAFFDVDAAANSHDGRSLKAERSGKKLSKSEVKAFREKRRERKEEKRRAWLRD